MKELSLHILDIAQNSIAAGAKHVDLTVEEGEGLLRITVADDGRGMSPEFLASVTDPFTTTRTTRKVGLGLPLLRLAAEQTGGELRVESQLGVGTTVTATFHADHIDCPPLGDTASTVSLLAQGLPGTWSSPIPGGPGRGSSASTPRRSGPCWAPASPSPSRRWPSGCGVMWRRERRGWREPSQGSRPTR